MRVGCEYWRGRYGTVVQTVDGRLLAVEESGDLDGRPVLVHMGTPNSRRLYGPNVADAAGRGLRLISYDRPGYGGSAPHPGRTIADCAGDVRAICSTVSSSPARISRRVASVYASVCHMFGSQLWLP